MRSRFTFMLILLIAGLSTIVALSQTRRKPFFYLSDDSTSIMMQGSIYPVTSVGLLPDTVPAYLPRMQKQKFYNKRFHLMSASPDSQFIAFSCGEGDQWVGVMNAREVYMKFLLYSVQTNFLDLSWSPDSRYLAIAYRPPDHRIVVQIVEPPAKLEPQYKPMNAWQTISYNNEQYVPYGWGAVADTIFSFAVHDSLGSELARIDLPFRRPMSSESTTPQEKR